MEEKKKSKDFLGIVNFVRASYRELRKIDWAIITKSVPEHLVGILIIIIFFSLFFLGADTLVSQFIKLIFQL